MSLKVGSGESKHLLNQEYLTDDINDVTSDAWNNTSASKRRKWWGIKVKLFGGYAALLIGLLIGYFLSPDRSRWKNHTDACPAQRDDCNLLEKYSYEIQGGLALTISILLMMSWLCESPRRSFVRFVADNSKSVFAATITHFLCGGSAIAIDSISPDTQQCDWYLIIFIWDSLIGVSLTLIVHQWTARKAAKFSRFEVISRIGDYDHKPDPNGLRPPSTNRQRFVRWLYQLAHWIGCAIVCRGVDFGLLYMFAGQLGRVATGVGWWACDEAQVDMKLWLNILCVPIVLDGMQFTIQNRFLKMKPDIQVLTSIQT